MRGKDFIFSLVGRRREDKSLEVEVGLAGNVRAQLTEAEAHDLAEQLSRAAAKILAKKGVKLFTNNKTLLN